jgi:adenosyl cobinamide kinase/adenosyl cobinamide phosphate guanylyltransferase
VNKGDKKIILKYVNNINKIAINKGLILENYYLKKSNSMKYILNKKNKINIDKINKEMGFDNENEIQDVNKEELLINKSNKIKKYLSKEGKKILFDTLKKILNEDRILDKRVNYNDRFDRVFEKRRRENNFHKLAKQSIIIEKNYGKKIVPENEKEVIIKMTKKFLNAQKNSNEEIETNLIKHQILNNIDNQSNNKIKKNKY